MKQITLYSILICVCLISCDKQNNDFTINNINMKISTPAFEQNQTIPAKYTCDGDNINPELIISEIPTDTKSMVLIVDDPDAPAGDWVHWTVWNIDPQTIKIPENSIPANSIQGTTSFGQTGYGGPCPHAGSHHYYFKVYALDTKLDLPPSTDKQKLLSAIENHILDYSELIGLYKRI